MTHRLFVAIRPSAFVRERLLDTMEGVEGARWQDEEHLHVTLRFVGEVERPVANELAEALGQIRMPPFPLEVAGVSHFERKSRPHAIWAAVVQREPLEALRQRVERACVSVGLGRETRRFIPHITLARLNASSGVIGPWLAAHGTLRTEPWEVDTFSLFESHLSNNGSRYDEVVTYPLRHDGTEHR